MGSRRSGKSSIQRVVFGNISPHQTLFLEPTNTLDIKHVANNAFLSFQIWDFPGDFEVTDTVEYGGVALTDEQIFGAAVALVFVLDAQDEPYSEALAKLHATVVRASKVNPDISFEIFVHKVDGELFLSEEHKIDCQREIHDQLSLEPGFGAHQVHLNFHLTSIYDHSIFEAMSKVVQKLVPQLPVIENLMNYLVATSGAEKAFVFDVISKVYLATDSNPVDLASYELCSDMIEVVSEISMIYGANNTDDPAHITQQGGGSTSSENSSDKSSNITVNSQSPNTESGNEINLGQTTTINPNPKHQQNVTQTNTNVDGSSSSSSMKEIDESSTQQNNRFTEQKGGYSANDGMTSVVSTTLRNSVQSSLQNSVQSSLQSSLQSSSQNSETSAGSGNTVFLPQHNTMKTAGSSIKLNNGMVLYMREIDTHLALVCLLRKEHFNKQGLLDYNVDRFRHAIFEVFQKPLTK
eukprot:g1735.t1